MIKVYKSYKICIMKNKVKIQPVEFFKCFLCKVSCYRKCKININIKFLLERNT